MFADFDLFYFSCFIFKKKNHGFIEEGKSSEKVVITDEKYTVLLIKMTLENLQDSPRDVFIDGECGNLN